MNTTETRVWTPGDAARAARSRGRGAGYYMARCQARYVPNLTPSPDGDPWPVSDHSLVRLEVVPCANDAGREALEHDLAALDGATDHGFDRGDYPSRRPHAWVILPGDGSYCAHTREGWTKG
jgi:hypothetical protein